MLIKTPYVSYADIIAKFILTVNRIAVRFK